MSDGKIKIFSSNNIFMHKIKKENSMSNILISSVEEKHEVENLLKNGGVPVLCSNKKIRTG